MIDGEFELENDPATLNDINIDKKSNSRRHLFLGKRGLDRKRNGHHIHRIFIGKRGEIKRIFIG